MGGMTGRVGRFGRPSAGRGGTATAALAAGGMLAALGLSACGPDPAKASTILRVARAATVELAAGGSRPAAEGMTVPKGATVRTAPGGSASLVSSGRTVLLGSATAVTVVDGETETLRAGLVMIDARRSPGLTLDAGAATVRTARGGLARVERGALLRAASFRSTLTVRATGRKASVDVDRLRQVQVPDGGRPGRVTPLALTRDAWERRYALDLVTADTELDALAAGLDRNPSSSAAVLAALPASYASVVPAGAGAPRSETALAYVIATSTGQPSRYQDVRAYREDGGSWGVVAALVGADVARVSAALDTVLNPTEGPAALAAGGQPGAVVPGGRPGGNQVVAGAPPGGPSPQPGSSPSRRPSPSPSASPDPVAGVVTTVTGLLPSPTPSPSPSTAPSGTPTLIPLPRLAPLSSLSVSVGSTTLGLG